jgi:YHS domain-containing protein
MQEQVMVNRRIGVFWMAAALAALAATALPAQAQAQAQSSAALNLSADGVAIKGYDPVAYFTMNKPVKGSPSFVAKHEGATYWFANAEHQQAFTAQPAKYVPQYGGYCAFGVAKGAKPDIDPTAFAVVDGKLYLNLNPDVQSRWLKDVPGFIKTADENWKSLATKQ